MFKILSKRVVHSLICLRCSESSTTRPIRRINFSQPQRDSRLAVAIDRVEAWYRALKTFYSLALHPSNLYQFKLEPSNTLFHSICLMRKNKFISFPSQDSYLHLIIYAACMGALDSVLIWKVKDMFKGPIWTGMKPVRRSEFWKLKWRKSNWNKNNLMASVLCNFTYI